ncbi:WD40 repeat-like protein [Saccharata proteae CBS 121410]|uniref:WD40 repeat-like protein n=1 Tax=Saccharata proteae CBS 121410 TaxID=1314787 RepID=A0A9P4LVU6_9PEZI|nr:WD40 repeat-like protein [Saccharata proteae CBS 121410]
MHWGQLAQYTNGRTPGSCQTRYSKRLQRFIKLSETIDVLKNSEYRHILDLFPLTDPVSDRTGLTPPSGRGRSRLSSDLHLSQDVILEERTGRRNKGPANYYSSYPGYPGYGPDPLDEEPQQEAARPVSKDVGRRHVHRDVPTYKPRTRKSKHTAKPSKLPYLSKLERDCIHGKFENAEWDEGNSIMWDGAVLHAAFSRVELLAVKEILKQNGRSISMDALPSLLFSPPTTVYEPIEKVMRHADEATILQMSRLAKEDTALKNRTIESIEAFFRDAADGCLRQAPKTEVLRASRIPKDPGHFRGTASLLRNRELGDVRARGNTRALAVEMKNRVMDTVGPSLSFTGTSGDVNTVAWAPNGVNFAAGSACLVDRSSMQYNRPNNLLYGDLAGKSLQELPDHHLRREKPESGVNATHSMHVTQDPRLFQTVSAVAFSPDGNLMYSAGYDDFVRVWDVATGPGARLKEALPHEAKVDLLAVSKKGLVATGSQTRDQGGVKVFRPSPDSNTTTVFRSFTSPKAQAHLQDAVCPSSMRFDPLMDRFLLTGFAATSSDEAVCGETCLWDVETGLQMHLTSNTQNVFDVAWNPYSFSAPLFAVGCVAGQNANRGTRSVVKMYDIRAPQKYGMSMELECPALDMNDVIYCPYDENLVIAGCTDGRTYVWDVRKPDEYLYTLAHDLPLMEMGDATSREVFDTGIRFCSWGHSRNRLYTGSSDGVLKSWNLYNSPNDVFVSDIVTLNSGIMSGAFSPDYSSLLLGEVNGSINVLEVGNADRSIRDAQPLKFEPADSTTAANNTSTTQPTPDEDEDSGVKTASTLLSTGAMTLRPMGSLPIRQAVQGPNYTGPHDHASDADILRARAAAFQKTFEATGEQCTLPSCRAAATNTITDEESGDSGRSADRIPDSLRSSSTRARGMSITAAVGVAGKIPCANAHCGNFSRPRLHEDVDDTGTTSSSLAGGLCERCAFTCFRCGKTAHVHDDAEFVSCSFCLRIWRADCLGYRLLEYQEGRGRGRELWKDWWEGESRMGLGEREEGLMEYYMGRWGEGAE